VPSVRSGPFTVFDQLSEGSSLEDDDLERGTESKTFDAPPKARSSQVPRDADKPTIRPGALKVNAVMDSAPLEEDDNFIDRPTINISEGERPDDLSRPLSRLGQSEFISKVRLRLDRIYDDLDMLRKHRGIDKNTLLICGLIAGFFILVLFLILVL
jgi:hypothetical protein